MKVKDIFNVHNAKSTACKGHKPGNIPFITNGLSFNGFRGFVKPLKGEKVFDFRGICLSAFCEATVQEPPYLPRGNGGSGLIVLEPKNAMDRQELLYYASYINNSTKWRFSFGRMITSDRAKEIQLIEYDKSIIVRDIANVLPPKNKTSETVNIEQNKLIPITQLFNLYSGDYHKASALPAGETPLVSCGDRENGITRYVGVPREKQFQHAITIAYNGQPLTTKFHPYKFATKDDVAVCIPKQNWNLSTLIYIQYMLNRERWRYSFGRKCFREKLGHLYISMPVRADGCIDEDAIEKIVSNTSYWNYYKSIAQPRHPISAQVGPQTTLGSFSL